MLILLASVALVVAQSAQPAPRSFIAIRASTLIDGGLHPLILLPDGRHLDTVAMTQGFWQGGFQRDEILVHDVSSQSFVSYDDFQAGFQSLQNEAATMFDRQVYDSGIGRFQQYDEYTNAMGLGGALDEVLAQPHTLVRLEARVNALSALPDNCPEVGNPFQEDTGGFDTSVPDGIGDRCQCGDVSNDGEVRALDGDRLQNHLAGLSPGIDSVGLSKCTVYGPPGPCDVLSVAVLRRALAGEAPAVAPQCAAAQPTGP